MIQRIAALFLVSIFHSAAMAVDYYSFVMEGCKTFKGLIVDVNESKIHLVRQNGVEIILPRDQLQFVIIHNTYENPLSQIQITNYLNSKLKKVYAQSSSELSFTGWPIKFIDNLVVFYDTLGRTHVLELEKIMRLRPAEMKNGVLTLKGKKPKLSYGDAVGSCRKQLDRGRKGIIPTRVLGDKIQISEFLNNFETGYEAINSFQERTYLYAKPVLYDEPTKMGVTFYQKPFENPNLTNIPAYFQWSTGRPYRFQSYSQLGFVNVETLPTLEPLLLSRSEVKSHFFHGSFVGNLSALPAGTEYYTLFPKEKSDQPGPWSANKTKAGTAINYMALMGVDYQQWSFSIGTAYLSHYIQFNDYFREILGSSITPVFRLMYTSRKWRARGVLGRTNHGADNVNDFHVSANPELSVVGIIQSFSFESYFLRGGLDYELAYRTKVGGDFLFSDSQYKERVINVGENYFNWSYQNFQAYLHKQFGEYVALKVFVNSFRFNYDLRSGGQSSKSTDSEFITGGQFEFVF